MLSSRIKIDKATINLLKMTSHREVRLEKIVIKLSTQKTIEQSFIACISHVIRVKANAI